MPSSPGSPRSSNGSARDRSGRPPTHFCFWAAFGPARGPDAAQNGRATSMTGSTFWCEQAWLGGTDVVDGVQLTVTDGVISAVDVGVSTSPPDVTRLLGLTLPGFANAHSHAFHRALRGRTQSEHAHVLDVARPHVRARRGTRSRHLRGAGEGDVRRDGARRVHGCRGVPLPPSRRRRSTLTPIPTSSGSGSSRPLVTPGFVSTLLDACYLHGGVGLGLNEVQARFSDGSADAWADASQLTRRRRPMSHRGRRALRPGGRPGVDPGRRHVGN